MAEKVISNVVNPMCLKRSDVAKVFKSFVKSNARNKLTVTYPYPIVYQKQVRENGHLKIKDFFEWGCSDGKSQIIFNNGTPVRTKTKLRSKVDIEVNTLFVFNGQVCIFKNLTTNKDAKVFIPAKLTESKPLEALTNGEPLVMCAVVQKKEIKNLAWCTFDWRGKVKDVFYVYQFGFCPHKSQVGFLKFNIGDQFEFEGKKLFIHTHMERPCLCKVG